MRLRHIEVFGVVMQAGSISAAAHWLHVSQPAVTKALQQAEQQLGFRLFDRVKGKLHPTPEAAELYAEVEKLNSNVQAIRRLAANLRGGVAERVKVVATPALAVSVMPQALGRWRQRHPHTLCDLATQHTREIVEALLMREADVGFTMQPPEHPGIDCRVLARTEMVAIAPPGYWPAATLAEALPIAEFDGAPTIGFPEADQIGRLFADVCAQHGVTPAITTCVQTFQIARELVAAGGALALVDPFTASLTGRGAVVARPLQPAIALEICALTVRGKAVGDSVARMIEAFGDAVRAVVDTESI
ncbi:LysR family transcriptional regulator [Neisseriaceae bacterium JH1-16]|nr:LysR family transcriptional regulator [Neisseriaceae bacterium JH1-16]